MSKVKKQRFGMLPEKFLADYAENKVSDAAVALYGLLSLRWGGYDSVFPTQQTIAELAGCSLAKVQRVLKELNVTGWIVSRRQNRPNGSNEYFICSEPFILPESSPLRELEVRRSKKPSLLKSKKIEGL